MCDINKFMQQIFKDYRRLLNNTKTVDSEDVIQYWDIVVLTTFDDVQRDSFKCQIKQKKAKGQLPQVPIYVIEDPENMKLGSGGSTLHVLQTLVKEIGPQLYTKKILIIHSGGNSCRLPSYSTQGKIFSPVPVKELCHGSSVALMIDLKMSMYLPFCKLVGPGVFVTCADDIETCNMDFSKLDKESLDLADVIVLAHPSTIKVGEHHGVYVLDDKNVKKAMSSINCISDCLEVLQKPSEALMREKGAICLNKRGEEIVFSDSVFWLSTEVYRSLLNWYVNNVPDIEQLDAYAHFLPCFGSRIHSIDPPDFLDYRRSIFPLLKDYNMKAIVLNESKFYHLGTMEEYINYFTVVPSFLNELNIIQNTSNIDMPCVLKTSDNNSIKANHERSTVISSYFDDETCSVIVNNCDACIVIEWCKIYIPVSVDGNIILSNCVINKCSSITFLTTSKISLFSNMFYHTVPIIYEGKHYYVTVAFEISDDLKYNSTKLSSLKFLSHSIDEVMVLLKLKTGKVFPVIGMSSLWVMKLFSAADSPEESFWMTHNLINQIQCHYNEAEMVTDITMCDDTPLFSMNDLVKYKNLKELMSIRDGDFN